MANPINTLTGNLPLVVAQEITKKVNGFWNSGDFLKYVTPTTKDLLTFWFDDRFVNQREINFHKGQKQAILNTIYLHEIKKHSSVKSVYEEFENDVKQNIKHRLDNTDDINKTLFKDEKLDDIIEQFDNIKQNQLTKKKYDIPKYAIKMATGTGKTFVMNALLIWQYLNEKAQNEKSDIFTKNFLFVAPGLIVYERLLDSYLGKEKEDGTRDIDKSDIFSNVELFLPQYYRRTIKAFLSSNVVKKDEIGKKITGDGMIIITNWHLLMDKEKKISTNYLKDPSSVVKDIFPASPGTSAGNSLEVLDNKYFSGSEIKYLASLDELVVMNDEAHHIHENKTAGEIKEVEWQESLNFIAKNKGRKFVQIDFTATPYDTTGSGQTRTKHYFPHIIVDFDLLGALANGLVKLIAIDKRKELTALEDLDYNALRDDTGEILDLSDGQKIMIEAGLSKLYILEESFIKLNPNKHPKMLIMCEDTKVVDKVEDYLTEYFKNKNNDDTFMAIHSNKKGEIKADEYDRLKKQLFNLDNEKNIKVVISVLMLKEGFDVNNVCVIVPLRSTDSSILLEQTIGRGLRLMWRDTQTQEERIKKFENLKKKISPTDSMDMLHIIEHPKFSKFYDDLMDESIVIPDTGDIKEPNGEFINIKLKENYQDYDMYFIDILQDEEQELKAPKFNLNSLAKYEEHSLENLKSRTLTGQVFQSEEMTTKTTFGEYKINATVFQASSYQQYLQKLLEVLTHQQGNKKYKGKSTNKLPIMQQYQAQLLSLLDTYIKTKLFGKNFNPIVDENWKILLLKNTNITPHITNQFHKLIYELQNDEETVPATINKNYFSSLDNFNANKEYCLDLVKTIYEKTPFPSNKGGFEKSFLEFLDNDSKVEKFIKIMEFKHNFATITYFRDDGLMARYYPDFLVQTKTHIYIIETKADRDKDNKNVIQKKKATVDYTNRVNKLDENLRDDKIWKYLLVFQDSFEKLKNSSDIDDIAIESNVVVRTSLFE